MNRARARLADRAFTRTNQEQRYKTPQNTENILIDSIDGEITLKQVPSEIRYKGNCQYVYRFTPGNSKYPNGSSRVLPRCPDRLKLIATSAKSPSSHHGALVNENPILSPKKIANARNAKQVLS